jgi:hypothetical protein
MNGANGIQLVDSSNNVIGAAGQGFFNWIGSDAQGDTDEPNGGDGVRIEESTASAVSTNNTITANYIASNLGNGISLTGRGTFDNRLVNNFIGLGFNQNADLSSQLFVLPNKLDGVAISDGANNNTVGGAGLFLNGQVSNGAGNLISSNLGDGVDLSGVGTNLNTVQGNLIGTDTTGTSNLMPNPNGGMSPTANGGFGVAIANGAGNNLVGGLLAVHNFAGLGNLISANTKGGIDIAGPGTSLNTVQGNFIGTNFSGLAQLANGGSGVVIEKGASTNMVNFFNLISGNLQNGVFITGSTTTGNMVLRLN